MEYPTIPEGLRSNLQECVVHQLAKPTEAGSTHAVVDHSIQTTVAMGSELECHQYVGFIGTDIEALDGW